MSNVQKVMPCLWFASQAGEALAFYKEVFPGSRVKDETISGDGGPFPKGTLIAATVEIHGYDVMLLNGARDSLNETMSIVVHCDTQDEVDRYWAMLSKGGAESMCGWLSDKFGVSWQIVPTVLGSLLKDKDAKKAGRAMQAMLGMKKLDIAALERAHAGK